MSRRRAVAAALAAFVVAVGGRAAAAPAPREALRVRAGSELVNVAVVKGDVTQVSGGVVDELGKPIALAEVSLTASPEDVAHAAPCRPGDRVRVVGASAFATTDDVGFFCLGLSSQANVENATLRYAGDPYHSSSTGTVPREAGKRRLSLAFEASEVRASLDEKSVVVTVTPRVLDGGIGGAPVRLVLFQKAATGDGKETELAATDVPLGTAAKFDVETALLGPPGAGRLVARFLGSSAFAAAESSVLLERVATARLSLAAQIAPGDPADGVEILVGVSSVSGAVPDGLVEASVDGKPAGLAPVAHGASRLVTTFTPLRGRPSVALLRYVPAGSGYLPGEPITAVVPIRAATPWRAVPWLVFAGAVCFFIVRAWRRPPRTERKTGEDELPPSRGRAAVEVVETTREATGHRGRILDAHEGTPVGSARVSIIVPTFDGEGIAASNVANQTGEFSLPHVAAARNEGARLVVTAPFHATLSGPVPPDGVLTICLVSRRRALVDRLVAWADKAGRPWARRKESTPLELAEVAKHRARADVERWATEVAEAAYGERTPDERKEREIAAREPALPSDDG
ncbi:MAG TPA: hypothetical protein VHE30_01555 [Polyangiaceae bacterium]|nr:hypothetical protein [Polyangiaceae bacterium]